MTCVYRIMPKELYFIFISLDEFIIQIIHIYRNIRKVQKGMKEYQNKLELMYSIMI
jgi:predicted DNA-binding protein YlxM (UPF0122 family)